MWVSIPDDMEVPAPLIKRTFHGGLYAAHMIKMGGWDDWRLLRQWVKENGKYASAWGMPRWETYEAGMEHCLEEQLNFWGNHQNPEFKSDDMQLDLLFPVELVDIKNAMTMTDFRYLHLPAMRFIGMDIIAKGKKAVEGYAAIWARSLEFMPILDSMTEYASVLNNPCALMHHNNLEVNKEAMHYLVGRFMRADTPVPDGFSYWDIPESNVGISDMCGKFRDTKAYYMTRDKILSDRDKGMGIDIPYPIGYYHAELYTNDIPIQGSVLKFQYLFPCVKKDE